MRKLKFLVILCAAILMMASLVSAETSAHTLLSAAASVGHGSALTLTNGDSAHTWFTIITGSPTSVSVSLEGSIDNSNWFTLDISTSTTDEMRHVVNKPILYIRANATALSGGTSPTVTVKYIQNK